MTKIRVTLPKDLSMFMIVSRSILLRIRNVSDKIFRDNLNTHFMFIKVFSEIVPFMRLSVKIL